MTSQRAEEPAPAGSFTSDLDAMAVHAVGETVTVGDIEAALGGRGFATMSLILCTPFVQPIPLPGLSVVFGLTIALLGMRLTWGGSGGLPGFVTRREINTAVFRRIISGARKIFAYVERLFRRRISIMFRPPLLNLIGVSIIANGLALSLPLPPVILFSNALPAWATIALCLGYLERDGLFVVLGHALAIATWCYFAFWWELVKYSLQSMMSFLS